MKTLYLDIFSGVSGDMFIGALLDLGVDYGRFEQELRRLGLDEFHLDRAAVYPVANHCPQPPARADQSPNNSTSQIT